MQPVSFLRPSERIILNSTNWPVFLLPGLCNFILALLTRWPGTQLLRLLLFPISVFCCIHVASHYAFGDRGYFVFNAGMVFASLTQFAQALHFTFSATTQLDKLDGENRLKEKISNEKKSLTEALSEATQLMLTVRGIGFRYGRKIPLPEETRPLQKTPFLRKTFFMALRSYIAFDIIEFMLKFTPPLRTPDGGTMYIQSLPFLQRIIFATTIHILSGIFIIHTLQAGYYLASLISVGILNQSPSLWPPLFDHPLSSESLQQFWGQKWHQLLRHTFLVTGGYPCGWLGQKIGLPRVGLLFGTFLASGLFHEIPFYMIRGHFNWITPLFFLSQGFLIYLEHVWTSVTGRKVHGWCGRLCVYFSLFFLAQPLVNSWHMRGSLSGMVLHGKISPSRQLLLPILNGNLL